MSEAAAMSKATGPVSPGAVYLVGAGPGDARLLTVRAVQVLSSCDVVLHDRLVPEEAVKLAKPGADVRYVGKDVGVSTGKMKEQQDDISAQMVRLAQQGLSVCRLKGGDPMVFGRAGEEMLELAAANIPYEVVPAVTAALSAGADACIPLTYRHLSTSLRIYTMNPSTIKDPSFDWGQFNAPLATFALYMGLAVLPEVSKQLMAAGVEGGMPMALVDRASLPECQVVVGTVETLPDKVKGRTDLPGPALVLLGKVVEVRDKLLPDVQLPTQDTSISAIAENSMIGALSSMDDEALQRVRAQVDLLLENRKSSPAPDKAAAAG